MDILGIFSTMLQGDMWREDYLSMKRGRWKCSGMRYCIASALSAMTEILPEFSRYADKALWGWYAIHAPGGWEKALLCPYSEMFELGVRGEGSKYMDS